MLVGILAWLNGQTSDFQRLIATVSATFFASSLKHPATGQANTIIPISTLSNTSANDASVPPAFSVCFADSFVVFD